METALQGNVRRFLVPGLDGPVCRLPDLPGLRRAWGVHPQKAPDWTLDRLGREFSQCTYSPVAVGEIGLDKHLEVPFETQAGIFAEQLILAREAGLPVLIHLRGFWLEALSLLSRHAQGIPWVLHSYCGSLDTSRRFLDAGAFLSFSGSIARPNARKAVEVLREMPPDRILLETDAPDQPPAFWPHQVNEPVTLPGIGVRAARIRNTPWRDFAALIWNNTARVFPSWDH